MKVYQNSCRCFECRSIHQLQLWRLIKHSNIIMSLFLILFHELSKDWSVFVHTCFLFLPTGESHQAADWSAGSVHRWAARCSQWQEALNLHFYLGIRDFQPLKYGRVNQDVFSCCSLWVRQAVISWRVAGGGQEEEHAIRRPARRSCQVSEQVRMQPRKGQDVRLVSAALKSTGDDGELRRQRGG